MRDGIVDGGGCVREIPELLHAITHRPAQLARRWNRCGERVAFDLAERFVIREKERLVLLNRPADAAAELILAELRLHAGQGIARLRHVEYVLRIELVVAQEFEECSVKAVGAR